MTPAAFIIGLCIGLLIRSGLSAPSVLHDERAHLEECRALGCMTLDEQKRWEALEHG